MDAVKEVEPILEVYTHTGQIALGGFYTNEQCKYLKVESKKW